MAKVFLGLGSNVGDRSAHLSGAIRALEPLLSGLRQSPTYQSAPMYFLEQPPFVNMVVCGQSQLAPNALLERLKEVERDLGRVSGPRNGPRIIDIDILLYGLVGYCFVEGDVKLEIPHPRLAERRFVLAPLADLEPDLTIPGIGSIHPLLQKTLGQPLDVYP